MGGYKCPADERPFVGEVGLDGSGVRLSFLSSSARDLCSLQLFIHFRGFLYPWLDRFSSNSVCNAKSRPVDELESANPYGRWTLRPISFDFSCHPGQGGEAHIPGGCLQGCPPPSISHESYWLPEFVIPCSHFPIPRRAERRWCGGTVAGDVYL